jgi:hypothetical protein
VAKNKKPEVKTSLPASVKKAARNSSPPSAPAVTETKARPHRLNIESLLDVKDRAIIHPEEIQIGSFTASRETFDFILKGLGVELEDGAKRHDKGNFLYGIAFVIDAKVPFGKVVVQDPKGKILQTLNVAEI